MAFRYLIYRIDFGNTIVAESTSLPVTGGTTGATFTDFVIPEIQPLYLWRVTGGTEAVVPNTDANINAWLENEYPPSPDDAVTYNIFTGYTAQTATDLAGKINIVTGATGNVGEFDVSGNLIDSGFSISDLTGGTGADIYVTGGSLDGAAQLNLTRSEGEADVVIDLSALSGGTSGGTDVYVSGMTYVGSTLTLQRTEGFGDLTATIVSSGSSDGVVSGGTVSGTTLTLQRTEGLPDVTIDLAPLLTDIEADILTLSGDVQTNTTNITTVSGDTVQNAADILTISGDVITNTTNITTISGDVVQNTTDIQLVSGETTQNAADIAFLSGETAGKQDALSAGGGISVADLAADIIAVDLSAYTAPASIGITLTGSSAFIVTDNNPSPAGIQYAANYASTFVDRSLVDKAYVDALASGLDPKDSVNVATTVDIDLTGGTFGGTMDGITVLNGWRVLVKDQSNAVDNGIYDYVASASTFTRSSDFDGNPSSEVTTGAFTTVVSGDTQNSTSWVVTTPDPITVGTTPIDWTLLSKPINYTGGVGITVSGLTIIFDGASVAGNSLAWTGDTLNVDVTSGTLATALAGKLDVSVFSTYTGVTDTRLTNIEGDIVTISGDVVQNTTDIGIVSGATDQNASDIAFLSGATDSKLDTTTFNTYTGDTASNELFLVHTGGTELNTIIPTAIVWNTGSTDSSYSWTGGTIEILVAGDYEITYNIPYNQSGSGQVGIGGNLILNNTDIIDVTATGAFTNNAGQAGSNALPSVNVTFAANDTIDLVGFRTAKSGSGISSPDGSILIKKNDTLQ